MLKTEKIQQPPNVLFIQLLRFDYLLNKNENDVSPSTMISFCNKTYRLQAIIEHHGNTTHVGHYKTVMYLNNTCVVYDDDKIFENNQPDNSTGYIYIHEIITHSEPPHLPLEIDNSTLNMTITSQIDEDNIRTNAEKSPIFKQMKSKKKANTYSYKKITDLDDFDEAEDHESIRKSPIKRNPRDYNESTNKKVKTNNKAIDAANIWENNSNTSSRRSPNKRKPVDCNLSPNQQKSKYSKQKKISTQEYTIEPPQTIETEPVSDFDEDNIRTNTEESQVFKKNNSNNRADIFSYKRTLNLDDFYKACNQESIRKSPIKRKPINYTTSKNRKIKRLDMPIDDVNILGENLINLQGVLQLKESQEIITYLQIDKKIKFANRKNNQLKKLHKQ